MRLGVVFPQTEIGSDPAVIRDYAQAAESAGYDHLLVFDHVLGGKLEPSTSSVAARPTPTRAPSTRSSFCSFLERRVAELGIQLDGLGHLADVERVGFAFRKRS
jgi:hypothetical protein